MVDAAIRHVGDVEKTVDSAEIHKCAVVGDVLDHALHDRALSQLLDRELPLALSLFLEEDATRQNNVASLLVELDDLEVVGLTHHAVEVLHRAEVHLRTGQEGLDTDVHAEATLHAGHDVAADGLIRLDSIRDSVPCLHQVGLLLGQTQRPGLLRHAVEVDINLVANFEVEDTIDGGEFVCANRSLGLVANIHRDPVVGDGENTALDDGALFDGALLEKAVEEVLESAAIEVDDCCV